MPPTNNINRGKVAANSASACPFSRGAHKRVFFTELARRAQSIRGGLEGGHDLSAERITTATTTTPTTTPMITPYSERVWPFSFSANHFRLTTFQAARVMLWFKADRFFNNLASYIFMKGKIIDRIKPTMAKIPSRLVRCKTTEVRLSVASKILR